MICYETEMEAQRAITEINRQKRWRAEKYIVNKTTRTENGFKQRTHTSSKETETEGNDREKTNQTGTKDERTCYAFCKGHKIKDCASKLIVSITFKENICSQGLKRIMKECGTVESIRIKQYKRDRGK